MTIAKEITKSIQETAKKTQKLLGTYAGYKVTTAEDFKEAGEQLKLIKAKGKELNDLRMSLTRPLDATKKGIIKFFSEPQQLVENAMRAVNGAMIAWSDEQARIRWEEENRLRIAQEKETKRLQDMADKAAARAAAAKAEGNAEKARIDAEKAEAFEARRNTVETTVPVVHRAAPAVAGLAAVENWKFEIENPFEIPREFLIPDLKKIGELARFSKDKASIAGVRFYSEKSMRRTRG